MSPPRYSTRPLSSEGQRLITENYVAYFKIGDDLPNSLENGDTSTTLPPSRGILPPKEWIHHLATDVFRANTNSASAIVSPTFFTEIEAAFQQFLIFCWYINQVRTTAGLPEPGRESSLLSKNPYEKKYKARIIELIRRAPRLGEDLYQICFSVFLQINIRFFDAKFFEKAQSFLTTHSHRFRRPHQTLLITQMQQSITTRDLTKQLKNFKIAKVRSFLTEQTFTLLSEWIVAEEMLPILQLLNTHIDFRVMSYEQYLVHMGRKDVSRMVPFKPDPNIPPVDPLDVFEATTASSEPLTELLQIIRDVRSEPEEASVSLQDINICQIEFPDTDVASVVMSRDLTKIAVGKENSEIWLWDTDLVDHLQYYSSRAMRHWNRIPVRKVASELDFRWINFGAIAKMDRDFEEFNSEDNNSPIPSEQLEPQILRGHSAPIYDLAHYTRSNLLLSASGDTTIRSWDCSSGSCLGTYSAHPSIVWSIDVLTADASFISGGRQAASFLWDLSRTVPVRIFSGGHLQDVNVVHYHRNGNYIASGGEDGAVILWDVHTVTPVRMLVGHRGSVRELQFTRCGKYLASAGDDGTIRLWELGEGKVVQIWATELEEIELPVQIVQPGQSGARHVLQETPRSLGSVAFGDGDQIVAGTGHQMTGSVYLWANPMANGIGPAHSRPACLRIDSNSPSSSFLKLHFLRQDLLLAFSKRRPPPPPIPVQLLTEERIQC